MTAQALTWTISGAYLADKAKIIRSSFVQILKTETDGDGNVKLKMNDNTPAYVWQSNILTELSGVNDFSYCPYYIASGTTPAELATVGDGYDGLGLFQAPGSKTGKFIMFFRIYDTIDDSLPSCIITLNDAKALTLFDIGDYALWQTSTFEITGAGDNLNVKVSSIAGNNGAVFEWLIAKVA